MPDHWQETTLGEIADLEIGRTPPRNSSQYWTESLERPFCSIADMDGRVITPSREGVTELAEDDNKARRISAGSLLMSFKLTIGRMAFAGCDLFPNEAIVAITPNEVSASREFLYLNLGSRDLTEGSGQAVKGKTLNSKSLRAINIHLPSLDEQRRIVDLVGSIDTYIDSLETQIETTRTARAALLSELLSNPGDDWQETTLGDAADVVSGGTPRTGEPEFWNGEIVWVTPTEVVANEGRSISDSERKITPEGLAGSSAKMLPVDAVLLTSRATIGAVALAGVPLATNQGFASLVCGDDLIPRFAMYWCQANTTEFVSRAGGNTFLEISRKKVAAIPLLLPPLSEQRRIVDLVGSFDDQVSSLESQVDSVRSFRSGVLAELLSGERLLDESYDVAVGL